MIEIRVLLDYVFFASLAFNELLIQITSGMK